LFIDTLTVLIPASRKPNDWRDTVLILFVALGVAVAIGTEVLSASNAIRPVPLAVFWAAMLLAAIVWTIRRERSGPKYIWSVTGVDALLLGGVTVIAGVLLFTALRSPPNIADAMGYHLPRVVYWAQAGSVAFFPVHYYAQLQLQPLAEYFSLHMYVLSGGDRYTNLVQFFGFIGSLVAVSMIARELGANVRGQTIAAVACATLPGVILQASGAKNELLLSLWLSAMVLYALRGHPIGTGVCVALALATKGTAYVFAPALLAGALVCVPWRRWISIAPAIVICVLAINGPQYWRNYFFSGSILGFKSVTVDQQFIFANGRFGIDVTASNALRSLSEQLGMRSERWNHAVYYFVVRAHRAIGIDVNDPATTWRWTEFQPPVNANHEANANNKWHLLLFVSTAFLAIWFLPRDTRLCWWATYAAVILAFLLFCSVFRWQPYQARMHVPLFVLAAALIGPVLENRNLRPLQIIVCLFLLINTRHYLLENWTRPLKGPKSILRVSRDEQYFADMTPWHNKQEYYGAVQLTKAAGCKRVGIDNEYLQMEYPYQALLREWDSSVVFQHAGVHNQSARYPRHPSFTPCVVFCLGCAGKPDKQYDGNATVLGDSVLYVTPK
jgi:hypothetical protein